MTVLMLVLGAAGVVFALAHLSTGARPAADTAPPRLSVPSIAHTKADAIVGLTWPTPLAPATRHGLRCVPATFNPSDGIWSQSCDRSDPATGTSLQMLVLRGPDQSHLSSVVGTSTTSQERVFLGDLAEVRYDGATPTETANWVSGCVNTLANTLQADGKPAHPFAYESRHRAGGVDFLVTGMHADSYGPSELSLWLVPAQGDLAQRTFNATPEAQHLPVLNICDADRQASAAPVTTDPRRVEMVIQDLRGSASKAALTLKEKGGARTATIPLESPAVLAIAHELTDGRAQLDSAAMTQSLSSRVAASSVYDNPPGILDGVVLSAKDIGVAGTLLLSQSSWGFPSLPAEPGAAVAEALMRGKPVYVDETLLNRSN